MEEAANCRQSDRGSCLSLTPLLLRWQERGEPAVLERILREARPLIEASASQTLRRMSIRDANLSDDAVALVYDHLRRLPGRWNRDRDVQLFRPRGQSSPCGRGDDAVAFLRWLARARARDVARTVRRSRRMVLFSDMEQVSGDGLASSVSSSQHGRADDRRDALQRGLEQLDERSRQVFRWLAEGDTQAAIAQRLGIAEGTVSRIRSRGIAVIRVMLREPWRRRPR